MIRNTILLVVFFCACAVLHSGQLQAFSEISANDTSAITPPVDLTVPRDLESDSPDRITGFLDDILVNHQRERNPGTAVLLSAVLPGAGQAYNGDYLKVGVIYGIAGGLLYALDFNRHQFNRFNTAYEQRLKGEQDEFVGIIPNARGIRNFRDQYRKDMELTYIGLGVTYLFNIIDAFVAAHLATFDIDDDLSMQIRPNVLSGPHASSAGLGVVIRF